MVRRRLRLHHRTGGTQLLFEMPQNNVLVRVHTGQGLGRDEVPVLCKSDAFCFYNSMDHHRDLFQEPEVSWEMIGIITVIVCIVFFYTIKWVKSRSSRNSDNPPQGTEDNQDLVGPSKLTISFI